MKRCLILFVIFLVISCTVAPRYYLDISLKKPIDSNILRYTDNKIDIIFRMGEKQIAFDLQNKTETGIRINWDEVGYISPTGRTMRVIHSGIRLMDRNSPQAPTMVPPGSRVSDVIIPSENIYFVSGRYGGWNELDLFPGNDKSIYKGAEFGLYFPLVMGDRREDYKFIFRVDEVRRSQ